MRSILPVVATLASCCLLSLPGCTGDHMPTSPSAETAINTTMMPISAARSDDGITTVGVAQGLLTIDAASLTASWELLPSRSAQDNDAVFALSLERFFTPSHLRVRRIDVVNDELELWYEFRHPFRSSQYTNRADLGFAAMLMFGIDVPNAGGYTWFSGEDPLIADPRWITNADGYFKPGGLLDTSGMTANAFPYLQLLSDEIDGRFDLETGNPTGLANGRGNYGTPYGWHFQDSHHWSGFGVLHQGQGCFNIVRFDRDFLIQQGPVSFSTVLLAKYADPKSGTPGFEHRLPTPIGEIQADELVTNFGYRMPHGALDVSRAKFYGPSEGWSPNIASTSTLRFHVVDWDARAVESSFADLRQETVGEKVAQGDSGIPQLAVCIPGVLGGRGTVVELGNTPKDDDTYVPFIGDEEADSGYDNDPLYFEVDVTKPAGSGQSNGDYLAWLRVTDVEAAAPPPYMVALNPDLTPSTGAFPKPITYHPFLVTMDDPCPPPTGVGWATTFGSFLTSDPGPDGIAVDSDGNIFVAGDWYQDTDFGSGEREPAGSSDWFLVRLTPTGDYVWDKTWGGIRSEEMAGMLIDDQDRIWIGGRFWGTVDLGGGPMTAVSNNDILLARFDTDGEHQFSAKYGVSGFSQLRDIRLGPDDELVLTGYSGGSINFGNGVLASVNNTEDIWVANFDPATATSRWSKMLGANGPDYGQAGIADGAGNIFLTGSFSNTVNFGGDSRTSNGGEDLFLLKLDGATGDPVWVRTFGGTSYERALLIAAPGVGRITIAGEYVGILDLGAGPLPGNGNAIDGFLAQFDDDGDLLWSKTYFSPLGLSCRLNELVGNAAGDLLLAGQFTRSITLDGEVVEVDSSADGVLVRYAPNGTLSWVGQIKGAGNASVTSAIWHGSNSIYHGGFLGGRTDVDPSCVRTEIESDVLSDYYVSRITGAGGW